MKANLQKEQDVELVVAGDEDSDADAHVRGQSSQTLRTVTMKSPHCPEGHLQLLVDVQEQQRHLIAYEIHDGLAQLLAGVSMQLQAYRQLRVSEPRVAQKAFDVAVGLLGESIEETRRLIGGLRPPILDQHGLKAAVTDLVEQLRRQGGPSVDFRCRLTSAYIKPAVEHAAFRIIQESVSNACHHSKTDRIRIDLGHRRDGQLRARIRDWGVGFDSASVGRDCFGLEGIRERTHLLGGRVTIRSAAGRGTRIDVEFPAGSRRSARKGPARK